MVLIGQQVPCNSLVFLKGKNRLKLGCYIGCGTFWGVMSLSLMCRNHDHAKTQLGCGGYNFRWDPLTLDPTYDPSNASGELICFCQNLSISKSYSFKGMRTKHPNFSLSQHIPHRPGFKNQLMCQDVTG